MREVKLPKKMVSAGGIRSDPENTKALENLEAPTEVGGVRWLLGVANHLSRFLPHLSDITAPIRAVRQEIRP